ncbi:diacylglycerol kinase catalytic region [Candidatus Vecturithrix granuli]|uniref:Diacylglycerol kinase catalytic region n=1 Tax=Vecturithrix granuli TaxID=1499967 RepID=A0A081C6S8_VECG1|nr:diacylglycerol kinase catalytic region [Candidatus Vecturithrix granuli]
MIAAIVNPKSGGGKTGERWAAIQSALERELGTFTVLETRQKLDAIGLTRQALKDGTQTIIAVGGDGTLNEVVNGFFEDGVPIHPAAKLAVVLRGTGSDFVKTCKLPGTIEELTQAIKTGDASPCDIVRATVKPISEEPRERYFINVADVGIGGPVVNLVNNSSKRLGGKITFLLAGAQATLQSKNFMMRIKLDGETICDQQPRYFTVIANGKYFGGGMHIAPEANLNDGLFDVMLAGDFSLFEKIFKILPRLYTGKIGQLKKIRMLRGKRLHINADRPLLIEADGELIGKTDALFEILPSALQIVGMNDKVD